MQKIRVIHADDHNILRFGLREFLSKQNDIEVVGEAATGEECIAIFEEKSPDVCLIDIEMPGLNGLEVVRAIREKNHEVKLIILTMHSDDEMFYEAKSAGIDGYLPKDMAKQAIVEAIRDIVRGENIFYQSCTKSDNELNRNVKKKKITKREREILSLVVEGNSSPEIANKLYISRRTVDTHRNNLMQKLDVHNTASLVRYALQNKLIDTTNI